MIGGSRNGYKYLVQSNLDWGQDLKGLGEYLERNGIDRVQLGYYGSADARHYGIDYDYLPSVGLAPEREGQYWWYEIDSPDRRDCRPRTGTLAVSATLLASPGWMTNTFGDCYAWLKQFEPRATIGHTILIYEIE